MQKYTQELHKWLLKFIWKQCEAGEDIFQSRGVQRTKFPLCVTAPLLHPRTKTSPGKHKEGTSYQENTWFVELRLSLTEGMYLIFFLHRKDGCEEKICLISNPRPFLYNNRELNANTGMPVLGPGDATYEIFLGCIFWLETGTIKHKFIVEKLSSLLILSLSGLFWISHEGGACVLSVGLFNPKPVTTAHCTARPLK